jgi:hypothetical protein
MMPETTTRRRAFGLRKTTSRAWVFRDQPTRCQAAAREISEHLKRLTDEDLRAEVGTAQFNGRLAAIIGRHMRAQAR